MLPLRLKSSGTMTVLVAIFLTAALPGQQNPTRRVLLEVVSNSWKIDRDGTLVYLRVYSDGFAEAHPMRKVDFRNIEFKTKQLLSEEDAALNHLLNDNATVQLLPEYSRYWGNVDFGHEWEITISSASQRKIKLVNFQPFLARKDGKPYPNQIEKLGSSIWKLRAEVTGEPLEKDWLKGCAELGY
jgi:hypothetical protein